MVAISANLTRRLADSGLAADHQRWLSPRPHDLQEPAERGHSLKVDAITYRDLVRYSAACGSTVTVTAQPSVEWAGDPHRAGRTPIGGGGATAA